VQLVMRLAFGKSEGQMEDLVINQWSRGEKMGGEKEGGKGRNGG
jgi:hypothetical protein